MSPWNWVEHAMAAGLPNVVVIALDAAVLHWCAARHVMVGRCRFTPSNPCC